MLVAGACLLWAPDASAGCAASVVVDGRVLIGTAVDDPSRLPPRAGELAAIAPACHDGGDLGEEDHETTVVGLRGVPPHLAVVDRAGDTLYVDEATMPALRDHPLHEVLYGSRAPELRRCRPSATGVRGADEPVREGQRLRIATSRCGSRRVADRVTFVGPAPEAGTDGPVANPETGGIERWQVVLVLLFGSAFALMAVIWRHVGR